MAGPSGWQPSQEAACPGGQEAGAGGKVSTGLGGMVQSGEGLAAGAAGCFRVGDAGAGVAGAGAAVGRDRVGWVVTGAAGVAVASVPAPAPGLSVVGAAAGVSVGAGAGAGASADGEAESDGEAEGEGPEVAEVPGAAGAGDPVSRSVPPIPAAPSTHTPAATARVRRRRVILSSSTLSPGPPSAVFRTLPHPSAMVTPLSCADATRGVRTGRPVTPTDT